MIGISRDVLLTSPIPTLLPQDDSEGHTAGTDTKATVGFGTPSGQESLSQICELPLLRVPGAYVTSLAGCGKTYFDFCCCYGSSSL